MLRSMAYAGLNNMQKLQNGAYFHFQITFVIMEFYREITSLDSKTKTYESVGRMFLLADMSEVKSNLKKRQQSADEKIKSLENNKNYLERSLKEAENNLREMVQQKKSVS